MDNLDAVKTGSLDFLLQHGSTHGTGPHTCITGKGNLLYPATGTGAGSTSGSLGCRGSALGLCLHGILLGLSFFQGSILAHELQQRDSDSHSHSGREDNAQEQSHVAVAFSHHGQGDNAARRCRSSQSHIKQAEDKYTGGIGSNSGNQQERIHQDIWEVNLMDTAQEVNDDCTRRGALGTALAHQAVCQQDAKARARVCFQQEENGLACFLHLLDAHRGENTVVNSIVQEQHLCRFHKNRSHRQQAVVNQHTYTGSHGIGQGCNNRADGFHGNQCQHGCQNSQGEVVHQHLEARLDMAVHGLVKLLDNPS